MERLIYSKFSNERNSFYAIETSIVEDDSNKKWVLKKPMYADGKAHFDNMKNSYAGLKDMFLDSGLDIQPYIETETGLRFPYVDGYDMEKLLHDTYGEKGYAKVIQYISEYFDMIKKYSATEEFVKTSEFVKMFGEYDFPEGTLCGKYNNLDYGFANIIISEGKRTLIDYEWTVNFPVPLDFLLYRALHYYVYTCPESVELIQNGIFKDLGFIDSDIQTYLKMEQNFQRFISSGKVSLGELHDTMGQRTYNIHEVYSEFKKHDLPGMQVYYDYGEGFLHENSYFIKPEVDEDGNETIIIKDIPENALRIRIDPRKHSCVIKINKLVNEQDVDLVVDMDTNGRNLDNNVYIYTVIDPWIVIRNNKYSSVECKINVNSKEYVDTLMGTINRIDSLENKLVMIDHKYDDAVKQYNDIINSTSWKITEPFRKIRNRK